MKKVMILYIIFSILLGNFSFADDIGLSAKSAILIDASSGRILYEKNAKQKLPMASTTKIMTAIVAIENGNIDSMLKTSTRASHVEGSSIWLSENENIKFEDALYGLMLNSGNDAAIVLAENVGKNEENFVKMMNEKAREIGAYNTNFTNPHGLDNINHYTTAQDLALITKYALKNEVFSRIVGTKERKIPWEGNEWDRLLKNHNKLLWKYEYCNGVKTGFTKKSGRCLVSSASKNGMRFVAVTLNAGDDWNDHINLYNYGFSNYKPCLISKKNQYMKTVEVFDGKKDIVTLSSKNDLYIPIKNDEENKIILKYNVPDKIKAPITESKDYGYVNVMIGNEVVGKIYLKNDEYIEEINYKREVSKIIKSWICFINNKI